MEAFVSISHSALAAPSVNFTLIISMSSFSRLRDEILTTSGIIQFKGRCPKNSALTYRRDSLLSGKNLSSTPLSIRPQPTWQSDFFKQAAVVTHEHCVMRILPWEVPENFGRSSSGHAHNHKQRTRQRVVWAIKSHEVQLRSPFKLPEEMKSASIFAF